MKKLKDFAKSIALFLYPAFLMRFFEAKGWNPHYSNVYHVFVLGVPVAYLVAWASEFSTHWTSGLSYVVSAFLFGTFWEYFFIAGNYVLPSVFKEKKTFDWLDANSTGFGGVLFVIGLIIFKAWQ